MYCIISFFCKCKYTYTYQIYLQRKCSARNTSKYKQWLYLVGGIMDDLFFVWFCIFHIISYKEQYLVFRKKGRGLRGEGICLYQPKCPSKSFLKWQSSTLGLVMHLPLFNSPEVQAMGAEQGRKPPEQGRHCLFLLSTGNPSIWEPYSLVEVRNTSSHELGLKTEQVPTAVTGWVLRSY